MPTLSFTDRKVRALPDPADEFPHSGRLNYFDVDLPGFGLRCTRAGSKSWFLMYRVDGVLKLQTLAPFSKLGLAEARKLAKRELQRVAHGEDPARQKQEARQAPTVAELSARYLSDYAEVHKRPASVKDDRSMLEHEILPRLGTKKVAAVEREDVEALHRAMKKTPYRANRVLALLSKMFSLAEAWRLRPQSTNPAKGIPRYQEQKRDRWLSGEELKRLTAALDDLTDQSGANAIRLLILTGSRLSEVLTASWDQFDFDRGVWTKPAHSTKQKKVEHVPLSAPVLALLATMKEEAAGDYLFPGRRAGEHRVDLKKPWSVATKAAGLEGVRLHDLRHSFASHLVSSGLGLSIVGRLLGHTQAATTMRYAHLADDPLREATDRFGAMFVALKNGDGAKVEMLTKGKRRK